MNDRPELAERFDGSAQPTPALAYSTPPPGTDRDRISAYLRRAVWACVAGMFAFVVLFIPSTETGDPVRNLAYVFPFAALGLAIAAWHVASDDRPRRRAGSTVALTVILCAATLLASMLTPNLGKATERGNRAKCKSNLQQLGQAIAAYGKANQGQLPADWAALLFNQELPAELLVCPSSNDERAQAFGELELRAELAKPNRCSYIYLGGGRTTAGTTPAHVIAYEPLGSHSGRVTGIHVLYGDGRVNLVDATRAARLVSDLQAGINPPRP